MNTPSAPQVLRLFVSSPMDVPQERQAVAQVMEGLRSEPLLGGKVVVLPILWELPGTGMPLLATTTPQEAINRGMCRPSECDLVIVILAARLGTPLPREVDGKPYLKPDGSPFRSGTEWEFCDALRGHQENSLPEVLVFRRTELPALNPTDPDFAEKHRQRQLVEAFFAEFRNADGSLARGYESYATPEDFAPRVGAAVRRLLPIILKKREQGAGSSGLPAGQCPHCRHVHTDWQKRIACEQCAAFIREPCTGCSTLNGVWSKFCGICRIDLKQGLQRTRQELATQQREIVRLEESDQLEAALARQKKVRVPKHSTLDAIREWFARRGARLQEALQKQAKRRRAHLIEQQHAEFARLAEKGRWQEAVQTLEWLRRECATDSNLNDYRTELAEGLRKLVCRKLEDRGMRQLYLRERTSALAAKDVQAGERQTSLMIGLTVPVCIVLCPLLLFLPTFLKSIQRMEAARRWREYGPLPWRALFLSEEDLQRRYRSGKFTGPYEDGFSPLKF